MAFEVLPAIDLRRGRCVRLLQGDPGRETVYGDDPPAMAAHWTALGATRIHVVDLDGAFDGRPGNLPQIEAMLAGGSAPLQVGGGIRDEAAARALLEAGVSRIVLGTAAVLRPALLETLCAAYPGRIVLGVDTREGKVATDGWTRQAQTSGVELVGELGRLALGAVVYTDIARDGMLSGPNLAALEAVVRVSPVPVIASGGIAALEHVRALIALGAGGMIVGQALYTGALRLPELIELAGC